MALPLIVATTLLLSANPAVVSAEPSPPVVGGSSSPHLSPEFLNDLAMLAKVEGITLEQAIDRFGGQEELASTVEVLQHAYPDSYSSSSLEQGPNYDAWVSFKGHPGPGALNLLSRLPMRVLVITDAVATQAELLNSQEAVAAAISRSPQIEAAVVTTDPRSGYLQVRYKGSNGATPSEVRSIVTKAANENRVASSSAIGLEVVQDAKIEVVLTAAVGGRALGDCTAGFTVINQGGVPGVSSAEHCTNSTSSYVGYTATYQSATSNSLGGLQRYKLSGPVTNQIQYISAGNTRTILGSSNPVNGAGICYYGKSTGNHCTTVGNANRCFTGAGISICNVFTATNHTASFGDSGGPWYSGSTAKAIMQGYWTDGWGSYDFGTRIGMLGYLGLAVKTTP